MAVRSSSSAAAAMFLATILLLAATSALAQAPAPAPSSSCPVGLDQVSGGSLSPPQLQEIASELLGLGTGTATQCVCNAAQGSTPVAKSILNSLGLGLVLGMGLDCSNA